MEWCGAFKRGQPIEAEFFFWPKSAKMSSKTAAHRKSTKSGIDIDEARRKREDNIIELRKNKRDENLLKKRQTFAAPNYAVEDSTKQLSSGQRVRVVGRTALIWPLGGGDAAQAEGERAIGQRPAAHAVYLAGFLCSSQACMRFTKLQSPSRHCFCSWTSSP